MHLHYPNWWAAFVFLFGLTEVRFNFIDDVVSLYDVG